MARHVKVVSGKTYDANTEVETATLAKKVYDVVNGKTFVSISAVNFGQNPAVIVVYDD